MATFSDQFLLFCGIIIDDNIMSLFDMAPYYIKHSDGNYCYFKKNSQCFFLLVFIEHFIANKIITKGNVIESLTSFKSHLLNFSSSFDMPILEYLEVEFSSHKHFHQSVNEDVSLQDIQNNYLLLLKLYQLSTQLEQDLLEYKKYIQAFTYSDIALILPQFYQASKDSSLIFSSNQSLIDFDKQLAFDMTEFDNMFIISRKIQAIIDNWQHVLDDNGKPFIIEENTALEHFGSKHSYAIFFEQYNGGGYFNENSNKRGWVMSIAGATLFESIEEAKQAIDKHHLSGVIVEVKIELSNIISNQNHIDINPLESILICKEKKKLENNHTHTLVKNLFNQLLNDGSSDAKLVRELENFLMSEEKKSQNINRQKI
jgi:hypothetical protein